MPRLKHVKRQWIYIILFLVLFIMMIGLNSRLSEYLRLSSQKDEMTARIEYLQSTQISLETQVAYSNSDKAVEEWARTYEKEGLPGDQLIVPLPEETKSAELNYIAVPTSQTVENWKIWWDLFFE